MYVDFLSKYAISLLPDNTEAYGIYCDNWLNDERSEARFNKYTISKICFKKKNDALKEIDRHGFLDRYRSMKFYKTLSEISKP
ncbi:hypothetical protein EOM86_14260 [Candidatus Nomurabacteria bacterium]|nr:hypothetical protein [Candidatus Nomurabacteria bacterium]